MTPSLTFTRWAAGLARAQRRNSPGTAALGSDYSDSLDRPGKSLAPNTSYVCLLHSFACLSTVFPHLAAFPDDYKASAKPRKVKMHKAKQFQKTFQ